MRHGTDVRLLQCLESHQGPGAAVTSARRGEDRVVAVGHLPGLDPMGTIRSKVGFGQNAPGVAYGSKKTIAPLAFVHIATADTLQLRQEIRELWLHKTITRLQGRAVRSDERAPGVLAL